MVVILIIVFPLFSFYEISRLKKEGLKKEIGIFSVLTIFAFIIALLQIWNIDLPNPSKLSEAITYKLLGFAIRFFEIQQ
jgi:ABC-type maltose transport system permease subunit